MTRSNDTTLPPPTPIEWAAFQAVLFDLDGVVTKTAVVHAAAWSRVFDDYLAARLAAGHPAVRPFDPIVDYQRYVDGKLRQDGVRSFLESRGIHLPQGTPQDGPEFETIHGIGNKKDAYFQAQIDEQGIQMYEDAVAFLHGVRARGLRTAVVSASKHTRAIVETVGLAGAFDVRIDGLESQRLGLSGKPAPDSFLEAARRLHVLPTHAIVVEDAVSGVRAGRNGGFGLVIGVDRTGHGEDLQREGAHLVTSNLTTLLP